MNIKSSFHECLILDLCVSEYTKHPELPDVSLEKCVIKCFQYKAFSWMVSNIKYLWKEL